jgi:hypothetical protein
MGEYGKEGESGTELNIGLKMLLFVDWGLCEEQHEEMEQLQRREEEFTDGDDSCREEAGEYREIGNGSFGKLKLDIFSCNSF